MPISIIAQPPTPTQEESSHFDLALSLAIDLAHWELDYHREEAQRYLALLHYHLIGAELAEETLHRLQRRIVSPELDAGPQEVR